VVIQAGILRAKKDGEAIERLGFLNRRRVFGYSWITSKRESILRGSDPNKFIAKMGAEALA
jgi:hypothetical protein